MDLQLDGARIFLADQGRAFDPRRPTMLLVHGAGMDHSVWPLQARHFAYRGWNALALDLPGHGRSAGRRFIEACELASHLANVGDAKTLVIHPASTTHLQIGAAALAAAGVGEDMIRLSVGLEDPADIVADLERALQRAHKA
jgi:O-acetylhomoserine (thiol)-lyase